MAEVIVKYEGQVRGRDRKLYEAQACGRGRPNGLWEGCLEFIPVADGTPLVSERETTQPNRTYLEYWASGLTSSYLDGALARVQTEVERQSEPLPAVPMSDGPRPHFRGPANSAVDANAVLSAGELERLSEPELVTLIMAAMERQAQ